MTRARWRLATWHEDGPAVAHSNVEVGGEGMQMDRTSNLLKMTKAERSGHHLIGAPEDRLGGGVGKQR